MAKPIRLDTTPNTILPFAASSNTGMIACSATPFALICAAPTKNDHSRKYGRKIQITTGPRRCTAPSMIVCPVASCQRAIPSVTTNFMNAPSATAQSTAVPSMPPTNVAVARSPPPTPVAASNRPGPRIAKNDSLGLVDILLLARGQTVARRVLRMGPSLTDWSDEGVSDRQRAVDDLPILQVL